MSGLFGGCLGLVNILGTAALYVLIGKKALKPDARGVRLFIGSLLSGGVLGAALALLVIPPEKADGVTISILGFLVAVMVVLLTALLEGLRRGIKD